MLDGDEIVYVAQVQPSTNFMRMFTEVGRRTLPHATAVGKAILADRPDAEVTRAARPHRDAARTPSTRSPPRPRSSPTSAQVRQRGYALDDGEQELGVRCVAVVGARRARGRWRYRCPGRSLG